MIEVEKCYAHKNKMSSQRFWHCVLTVGIVQHIQETVRPLVMNLSYEIGEHLGFLDGKLCCCLLCVSTDIHGYTPYHNPLNCD